MRKETKTEKVKVFNTDTQKHEIVEMQAHFVVHDLVCECGEKGGTITFPAAHGRENDAALEAEIKASHTHVCDTCCCKGRDQAAHPNFNKPCKVNKHI